MANERARQLRRNRAETERRLWHRLRELKQIGFRFRQQVPIDHYVVDFACLAERLVVEVDGGTHGTADELAQDARREAHLRDQGFHVMRFWNADVRNNVEGVIDSIVAALQTPTPNPSPQGGGETVGASGGVAARKGEWSADVAHLSEGWRLRPPLDGEGCEARLSRAEPGGVSFARVRPEATPTPDPSPLHAASVSSTRPGGETIWRARVHKDSSERAGTNVAPASYPSPASGPKSIREGASAAGDEGYFALARAHRIAAAVPDPEIPVLTLQDLGVLRGVERRRGRIIVKITPTYTGCPATLAIKLAVETALAQAGLQNARVETVLSPPWSSDQITEEGRRKLAEFGIAPPRRGAGKRALFGEETVSCPKCGSTNTARISEFGSTACKALWRCQICAEPFDYFKCI